jgi:methylated-DNA-[protein]-cysteine S-methyltransferase
VDSDAFLVARRTQWRSRADRGASTQQAVTKDSSKDKESADRIRRPKEIVMPTKEYFLMESSLGTLTLVNIDGMLSGIYMPDHLRGPGMEMLGSRSRSGFEIVVEQLHEYFNRRRTEFTFPISATGTVFQQRVWDLLRSIPYGETRTYAQLADAIGNRAAIRAVGLANGRNPISIVIPCHRVVGSDGSLTGYAGGLDRKRFLLELENAPVSRQSRLL